MKAGILTIGDELLVGQVLNTNVRFISGRLSEMGVQTSYHYSVADSKEAILAALRQQWSQADLHVLTGGLGPTRDDVTVSALAEFFESELVFRPALYERLVKAFGRRNILVTEAHRNQYLLPDKARLLVNRLGSAPGLWFEKEGKNLLAMPGVPYEMESIFTESALPLIEQHLVDRILLKSSFCTAGAGETTIADHLTSFEDNLPAGYSLSYLPGTHTVRLRLDYRGPGAENERQNFDMLCKELTRRLGPWIFGTGDDTLESVTGDLLKAKGRTISTAESCTGGYLAHRITSIEGSSDYYMGSVLAYDNHVKTELLGVSHEILQRHGAVSEETACTMAQGVRKLLKTDLAISTTGVAGPAGGTIDKPVGTVWIGYATANAVFAERFFFGKDRLRNIEFSSLAALNGLRKVLSAPEN